MVTVFAKCPGGILFGVYFADDIKLHSHVEDIWFIGNNIELAVRE